jgi:spermidine synthase
MGRSLALHLAFAAVSGALALVYQVIWTRELALLSGSHVEAVSLVLVVFFGGLAAGSRLLGPLADHVARPLRLFALLEAGAGGLAMLSSPLLRSVGERGALAEGVLHTLGPALLLPATFLLGGTLPALVRSAARHPDRSAEIAGRVLGVNTLGAVCGVAAAAWLAPTLGLAATLRGAGLLALAVAAVAAALSVPKADLAIAGLASANGDAPGSPARRGAAVPAEHPPAIQALLLAAAALAGAATLAYEVLAARAAALLLGSSLLSWASVLGSILAGLALGNLLAARRAARSGSPETCLGLLELAAAAAVILGLHAILPSLGAPASGVQAATLATIVLGVGVPAGLMGAAFPFFVRVIVGRSPRLGGGLGRLAAANTAGGIAGALAAPFLLLPAVGPAGGALACATVNGVIAVLFLARGAPSRGPALARMGAAVAGLLLLAGAMALRPPAAREGHILFVGHGAQATAVVVHHGARRDLIVDGEAEASTGGAARRTEELLAVLPLLLHPEPQSLLEVGLGSGITLATAARFPLETIECVEIAPSVLAAAAFFVPDNGGIAAGRRGVRILRGDGRVFLTRRPGTYDIVLANTVHPWSVGSTGLYSTEYYQRVARVLAPGGVAAQWLPIARIGGESFAALVATFFSVFPHGELWWGDENVILVGSKLPLAAFDPLRAEARLRAAALTPTQLGLRSLEELLGRRLARAEAIREALAGTEILSDDKPILEARAVRQRGKPGEEGPVRLLVSLAEREGAAGPLVLWLRARLARAEGRPEEAQRLADHAERAGLTLAREARLAERMRRARAALAEGLPDEATRLYRAALAEEPGHRTAAFGLAVTEVGRGHDAAARDALAVLLEHHSDHAEGWNLLGILRWRAGERNGAREALEQSLEVDPFLPAALANAGLLALELGDRSTAERLLGRLRGASPLGPTPEERALRHALVQDISHAPRDDPQG